MLKKILAIVWLCALTPVIFAQSLQVIRGKIVNKKTGEPVGFASVYMPENELMTSADESGVFVFRQLNSPFFTLEVKCLGFETFLGRFETALFTNAIQLIELMPVSYDMQEIDVLAKTNPGISSSSIIGSAAIEHVQPTSLADIMQLLPGNLSVNPNLSSPQKISIREIGVDNNSAMGTAIFVDGSPTSNDANLQTYSTSRSGDNFSTVAGSGIDLRQISTDQIESVEVIRGIPSVTYGDLTSGAILIRTKAGYTPYEIKLKTDPKIKQFTFGKGLVLKASRSNLNLNFDYLQSYDDLRSKYTGFNRLTSEVGFSKTFSPTKKPFSYNTKLSYFETIDDAKTDPDALVAGERIKSKDRGLRVQMFGKWSPDLKLLSSLDYTFSVAYSHQISSEDKYRSLSGIQAISTAISEGENTGIFLPSEQFTSYVIDGEPVTVFGQITAKKTMHFKPGMTNKILYGLEYRMNANYGDGQVYDASNPPFVNSSRLSFRPRKFSDIPALQSYSVYLEDKLFLEIRETVLEVQAGFRLNNFQSDGLLKSKLGFYAEPRFNAQYWLITPKNKQVFDKLAISFGAGKTYKSPSLLFLFPDKAYFDLNVLSYYTGNPDVNTSIFDTRIFETGNQSLQPSENLKMELGLSFRIRKVNGSFTIFKEDLSNGYSFVRNYMFLNYSRYLAENVPVGVKPNPADLKTIPSGTAVSYLTPVNNQETQKSGVEFSIDFGKIPAVYTSITLDGAWLNTKQIFSTIPIQYQPPVGSSDLNLLYGIYPAGESKISRRLNTNLRMVSHIPRLRMILSTTMQMVWYDMYSYPVYDEVPVSLVSADGSITRFTSEMRTNPDYIRFVSLKNPEYYLKEVMPPLPLVNFRLSKEIYDRLKLSFYVNNVVNYRPDYKFARSGSFTKRNPSVYFGAEIKLML